MRLPIVDPRDLVAVVPRVLRLIGEAELLLTRAGAAVARIESTRSAAAATIDRVDATVARADALVVLAEPAVLRLLPALERLAATVGPAEVDCVVRLLKLAPELVGRVQQSLDVLDGLTSVSPDLQDLLASSRELNELLGGLPGMGRVKKRVEEAHQEAADD